MSKYLIILIGLSLLALLGYFCIYKQSPHIQHDIDTRAHSTLATYDLEHIDINTDGRDITLNGVVASEEISKQAEQYAKDVYGVNIVNNQLTIAVSDNIDSSTSESLLEKPADDIDQDPIYKPEPELESKLDPPPEYTCQQDFDSLLGNNKISFATNSSDIDISSNALLNELVEVAKQCPEAKIEISGHTDSRGRDEYNLQLSQKRATSVMNFMINNGVDANRLSAIGYGENNPIADNETPEGLAKNRRIEFNVEGL